MGRIRQRIKNWFGSYFTPDNTIVPVMRREQFHRYAGPGYFHINPLKDRTLPAISLGAYARDFNFSETLTCDHIGFNISLTILYRFDPREAAGAMQSQLASTTPETLAIIVEGRAEHFLRRLVACHDAEKLCRAATLTTLEQDLYSQLCARLSSMGIVPLPNGVLIKAISAPEKYREAVLAAKQYQMALTALGGANETRLDQVIRAKFVAGLEKNPGNMTLISTLEGLVLPTPADIARLTFRRPANGVGAAQEVSG